MLLSHGLNLCTEMPNSSLQTTRVFWRDMLHMEQMPDDAEWYEIKKRVDGEWFHCDGLARRTA